MIIIISQTIITKEKMHRQSSAYEQKPVTEETSRYSSLPIRTFTEQDTSLTKSP